MTRIKRKCFMNPGQMFANEARQQMALIRSSYARLLPEGRKNKCSMHKRGGSGVVRSASPLGSSKNQPFYAKFI